jgi:hypothetical protein
MDRMQRSFDQTWYCNQLGYDIRAIKPYAAYDVGKDEWVVKPPHLPHWGLSELPEAVQKVLRACDRLARDILKLPEPERTQQGAALFDAWHSDRSRAFGPNGEGWYDIANLREKWLDQAGLWAQLVDCKHKFDEGLGAARPDWSNDPLSRVAAPNIVMMKPSELATHHGRDDLDQPWMKHKIDDLRNSIIENGYDPEWGDPIKVSHSPEHGPTLENGNKRVKVLNDLGYDWPIPVHKSGAQKIAMPWEDRGDLPEGAKARPKAAKRAGFVGFVSDSQWDRHTHKLSEGHPDKPDFVDDHLSHFVVEHGSYHSGKPQPIDLSKGVYATQSHVAQFHIDRYKRNPETHPWAHEGGDPDAIAADEYPGSKHPMFVTHQGRLHVSEGHHRVAASLQTGQPIDGYHHDLDAEPVIKKANGQECEMCRLHALVNAEAQRHAEARTGSARPSTLTIRPRGLQRARTALRGDQLWGKGIDALFGSGSPVVPAPFPQAGARKDRKNFDTGLVARSITHPHEFSVEKVDPRELHATQPSVTHAGVKHYFEGGQEYGKNNGGDRRLGNDIPRIYHRSDGVKLILTGHHRASSALLKGEPLDAMVIHGGWGEART